MHAPNHTSNSSSSSTNTPTSFSTFTTSTINNSSRFLSPTASSAARRRETLMSTPKKKIPSNNQSTIIDEKQSSSKKTNLIHTPPPNHSAAQSFKHTNSVPSKRGTLLYDPKNAPSTVSKSSSKTTHQLKPQPQPPTFASPSKKTSFNLPSPRSTTSNSSILRIPKSPPNNYIPENHRDAWANLQTLGVMSPYSKSLFGPSCPETPFYKKQGRFGNIILQTSLSKMTKGIMLDNEEYLTVGCYTQCNIRVNHKCLIKFDPDHDEEGYPCIFLCVYEGANLIKLNGEVLEGLMDEDMDGILLKHDDEIRIVDKLFYYENLNQYEREKMKLVKEIVSKLPLFDEEKENQPNRINSTPQKNNEGKSEMFSPPPTGFSNYVDTPKRKKSISTKRNSIVSPYEFQMNATQLGSFTVATDSSLLYDCNNDEIMASTGRKSVSFGDSEIVMYKPSHEPRRVSAARLQIDDDFSTSLNDDSTISFGCDNSIQVDDVTITQSNLTSLSNLCQIICLQTDQQCTVQPVNDTGKPPVLDCDDIDLLIDEPINRPTLVESNAVEVLSSIAMDISPKKEQIMDEDSIDAVPTPSSSHSSKASNNSSSKKRTPVIYASSDSESDLSSCRKSVLSEEDERFLNEPSIPTLELSNDPELESEDLILNQKRLREDELEEMKAPKKRKENVRRVLNFSSNNQDTEEVEVIVKRNRIPRRKVRPSE